MAADPAIEFAQLLQRIGASISGVTPALTAELMELKKKADEIRSRQQTEALTKEQILAETTKTCAKLREHVNRLSTAAPPPDAQPVGRQRISSNNK